MGNSAEHVHAIDLSDRSGTDLSSSPFYAASLHDAVESLEIPRTARLLSRDQVDDLAAQLQDFIEFVPSEPSVLNHGDLYIGNAIWGGTDVVGLVELEFAVLAPVEVDLNAIVKHAFASGSVTGRIRNCASIVLHREHHALRLPGSFDEPCRCWIVGRWSPVRTVCGNARSGRHFWL